MKKNWFNQSGGALVLVLITITIIGILVPTLMFNILSSANQYQKTEESFQRAKLEEMAELHFEKTVKLVAKVINSDDNSPDNKADFLVELNNELNMLHPVIPTYLEDKKQKFRIEFDNGIVGGLISYSIVTIIGNQESESEIIENPLDVYLNIEEE